MAAKMFRGQQYQKPPRRSRLWVTALEERWTPAGGQLDTSFAGTGIAVTPFPLVTSQEGANGVAVDSVGRTIIGGYVNNGALNNFAVARYLSTGALDTSFGTGGLVTNFFGPSNNLINSVTVDFLDRVVVAGFTTVGSNFEMAVARLTTTGALDTSFSSDGLATLSFGSTQAFANGLAVDSLNRVVVAGSVLVGSKFDVGVARLTAAGALDTSFSGDGLHTVDFNGFDDFGLGAAVDSLNRPVVAVTVGGATSAIGVIRMTSGGGLDTTFDGDGRQTITFAAGNESANGIDVDTADRPIVLGTADPTGTNKSFAVARLTTAGALDTMFDLDGKQTVSFASSVQPRGVITDSLNRVIMVGSVVISGQNDFAIARLNGAGGLDAGFNGTGRQTVAVTAKNDFAQGVAVNVFDQIIIGGRARPSVSDDIAVARLTTGGLLDITFNGTGMQTTGLTRQIPVSAARATAVDNLGRIVVVGFASNGPDNDFGFTRYLANGTVDTSFGDNGYLSVDFGGTQDVGVSVAIDSQGRIVAAGYTQTTMSIDFAVVRLTSAGKLDTGFDGDGRQTVTFGAGNETASAVAIDSADRIIIVGSTTNPLVNNIIVGCLTTTGALDSSFDGDGRLIFAFGTGDEFARAVAIDSMDRILFAGDAVIGSTRDLVVARLTGTGQFDGTFNGTGYRTIDFGGADESAAGITLDSENRIVVVGDLGNVMNSIVTVARLTPSGALDNSFNTNGQLSLDLPGTFDRATAVEIDVADRIVIAGTAVNNFDDAFVVTRLATGGALDSNFNGTGHKLIEFPGFNPIVGGLTLDQLGRPIIVGSTNQNGVNSFTTIRLTNPAQVAAIAVDINTGQRSMVRSMKIEFGTPVSFVAAPAAAFQLVHQTTMANVTVGATIDPPGHSVTLTFNGAGVESSGSLADGRYTLTILANQFTGTGFDGGGMNNNFVEVGGPSSPNRLFRLFGDSNGDGSVTALDFSAFRLAYGSGPSIFDFDGDNSTSAGDFNQFRLRYGSNV